MSIKIYKNSQMYYIYFFLLKSQTLIKSKILTD